MISKPFIYLLMVGKWLNLILIELTLNIIDNYLKSWFKLLLHSGRRSPLLNILFPMRSPGSHPPFRGFPLYFFKCTFSK
jgi:hypothetical protein